MEKKCNLKIYDFSYSSKPYKKSISCEFIFVYKVSKCSVISKGIYILHTAVWVPKSIAWDRKKKFLSLPKFNTLPISDGRIISNENPYKLQNACIKYKISYDDV